MSICETEHHRYNIEPCPFCLARAGVVIIQDIDNLPEADDVLFVRCLHCHAQGPRADKEAVAIAKWNEGCNRLEHYVKQMGRWVERHSK